MPRQLSFETAGSEPIEDMKMLLTGIDPDNEDIESVKVQIEMADVSRSKNETKNNGSSKRSSVSRDARKLPTDSQAYATLWMVCKLTENGEGVTTNDIYSDDRLSLGKSQVQTTMSTLYNEYKLFDREKAVIDEKRFYEYTPTNVDRAIVKDKGEPIEYVDLD